MSTETIIDEALDTPPKPKRVYKTKRRHKRRPKEVVAAEPFEAPEEFAGMTASNCCHACERDPIAQEAAMMRIHEIERAYPRIESRNRNSPTVMESDAEWLARYPQVADEWRKLWRTAKGECVISGVPACGHPFTGIRPRSADGLERWGRAKKALLHQRIELKNA